MKKLFYFLLISLLFTTNFSAQTADEVIQSYLEKSGGEKNWEKLQATKMSAEVMAEGMEIPLEIYSTKNGKQALKINFEGTYITQFAFDGEIMWTTDLLTMEPEIGGAEITANMKLSMNDFPTPLLNYKEKGYTAELLEEEKIGKIKTYQIKLVQEPIRINGETKESVSIFYFDKKTFLPVKIKTEIVANGESSSINESYLKDYKAVKGLYFPFTIIESNQEIQIKNIELNPTIDPAIFKFPVE